MDGYYCSEYGVLLLFYFILFYFILFFFFFKQKTAYEMIWWLEFRRVLFRSEASYPANKKECEEVRGLVTLLLRQSNEINIYFLYLFGFIFKYISLDWLCWFLSMEHITYSQRTNNYSTYSACNCNLNTCTYMDLAIFANMI